MKKILLLIFFVFSYFIQAQEISIKNKSSEVFKDDKKNTDLLFSESDGAGGFVTVRQYVSGLMQRPKGYYIDHYSENLKHLSEAEIEIDDNQIMGLMVKDNSIFLLESYLDKKADTYTFNVLESPINKLDFKKKSTLISLSEDEFTKYFGVGIGPFFISNLNQYDSSPFGEVSFSRDNNFFAVNFDIKNKEAQTQKLFVFDTNFNPVWDRTFTRDIKDKDFRYENLDVDDANGNVYILGKINDKDSKKDDKTDYHFELYKITATTENSVSFDSNNNFVGSLFTVRGTDNISCVGFYSEKNDSRYKGVVRYNLNPESLEITKSSFMPFSTEFINDKYGKVKDKELRNLKFKSAFINESGEIVLNAEEQYTTWMSSGMNSGGRTIFHYDDIVSVKMSKDGELIWARNINKKQATSGTFDDYLSFSCSVVNDDTYIFINCSDKIRKISNDRIEFKQGNIKKANLYAIKIDADGNYTYKNIVDNDKTEVPYFVRQSIRTGNDGHEMVLIGRDGKKKQFLKLNIL